MLILFFSKTIHFSSLLWLFDYPVNKLQFLLLPATLIKLFSCCKEQKNCDFGINRLENKVQINWNTFTVSQGKFD